MDWRNAPRAELDGMPLIPGPGFERMRASAQRQEPTEPAEPLNPQWVVVDRQVLVKLIRAEGHYWIDYDDELVKHLRNLADEVEQGRCTLLTQARWNGEDGE